MSDVVLKDVNPIIKFITDGLNNPDRLNAFGHDAIEILTEIEFADTVDAVRIPVVEQIQWERDVAIQQLEEHGIPFGGVAPDVVKVVRCQDCDFICEGNVFPVCTCWGRNTDSNGWCYKGERREENADD